MPHSGTIVGSHLSYIHKKHSEIIILLPCWAVPKSCLHGLINYTIYTKEKCRHLSKLTCKRPLRQVFIRFYRLQIQSVMLIFSTQLCELLASNLLSLLSDSSPPPLPCVIEYTLYNIVYTYSIQCVRGRGRMAFWASDR